MSNPQIVSDKKTTQVDFSHRFADACESDLLTQAETIIWMAERAIGVLHLLEVYLDHEMVCAHVQSSIYSVIAEIQDIKAVAEVMRFQGDDIAKSRES